jgi:hypothetical protein
VKSGDLSGVSDVRMNIEMDSVAAECEFIEGQGRKWELFGGGLPLQTLDLTQKDQGKVLFWRGKI